MAGGPPFYCPVLGKDRRRGNDRLGAGDYHGSRRRLRHSISAVGTETPSTKRRPLGPLSPADKINAERNVNPDLLIGIVALIIAAGLFRDRFAEQIRREPKIPPVLRGSNGLSGGGVDISSIGSRRIHFLGHDNVVVSLPSRACASIFANRRHIH
jgi:hypothetical protein